MIHLFIRKIFHMDGNRVFSRMSAHLLHICACHVSIQLAARALSCTVCITNINCIVAERKLCWFGALQVHEIFVVYEIFHLGSRGSTSGDPNLKSRDPRWKSRDPNLKSREPKLEFRDPRLKSREAHVGISWFEMEIPWSQVAISWPKLESRDQGRLSFRFF